jgi:isocitrate/isopropylmalate dehydrogenase
MGISELSLRIASLGDDHLTLYLMENDSHRAIIRIKKLKRKAKIAIRYIGEEIPQIIECSIKDDEVNEQCFQSIGLVFEKKFPGLDKEAVAEEFRKIFKEWENIRLAEELKAEEERLREGLEPLLEDEVEGKVIRILASDGAYFNAHGSFVDLGDYVVISESTFAYTQVETENGVLEKIEPVGVVMIYRREKGSLSLLEKKPYFPSHQIRIKVGDRLLRLRGDAKDMKADLIYSFPDIMTLKKILDGEEAEKEKTWADVGSEIIEKLKDYIVFDDERIYDVVASYIVMTYFYDVFTAVPFLYLHGPPGSGKTRANITITYMCRRGVFVADPSDATLYRMVEALGPTLGIDESVLSEKAKRILAAGYKKGAVVPRAEPTKGGIILKFFEATTPRIFSFEHPPSEDYLLQRSILINMLKAKPRRFLDPQPNEFKEIREALYYLRLAKLPEILDAREKALKILEDQGVWGREAETWAPILAAALLIGREKTVLDYILEDVSQRRANEMIYDEEKIVLAAIDKLFSMTSSLASEEDKVVTFMSKDLQKNIKRRLLEEEDCLEITFEGAIEKVELKNEPRCKELEKEIEKKWRTEKIGRILKNLGFDKYRRKKGKGGGARNVYEIKYSNFVNIARRYDYEPIGSKEENKVEKNDQVGRVG